MARGGPMPHPYRDTRPEPQANRDAGRRDLTLAVAVVWSVALLRCALAVVRGEAPFGDPLLAALVVIVLGSVVVRRVTHP